MFPSVAVKYLKLSFFAVKMNILSEMQYKTNFVLQLIGMFVNDSALTVVWMIFLNNFQV